MYPLEILLLFWLCYFTLQNYLISNYDRRYLLYIGHDLGIKFADDSKMGGVVNTPEGCAAIKWDLDRPESWAQRNLMEVQQGQVQGPAWLLSCRESSPRTDSVSPASQHPCPWSSHCINDLLLHLCLLLLELCFREDPASTQVTLHPFHILFFSSHMPCEPNARLRGWKTWDSYRVQGRNSRSSALVIGLCGHCGSLSLVPLTLFNPGFQNPE